MNRKTLLRIVWLSLAALVLCTPLRAQSSTSGSGDKKKLAQTGMKFLNVGMSARQGALADAFTAAEGYSASMFYNVAGMARLESFSDVSLGYVQWIADIKHLYGAVALRPFDGLYGVIGFTIQSVDYGTVEATILAKNTKGYIDLGTYKPSAYALGISYARALSDKFSIGGSVKFVYQDLGSGVVTTSYTKNMLNEDSSYTPVREIKSVLDVPAFDFGMLYRTGFKSLTLGVTIRNFSREVAYIQESFQLPLTFRIGLAMNVLDLGEMDPAAHSLFVMVDAEHPRDYSEQLKFGAEYTFAQTLTLRAGYVFPADEHGLSLGVGLQQNLVGASMGVDYAYTPFGVFTSVHRVSLRFAL